MYPSRGPPSGGFNFVNPIQLEKGGNNNKRGGYPNGLVGAAYNSFTNNLPGVKGIPGDANHYPLNKNPVLQTLSYQNIGANPPFLGRGGSLKKGGGITQIGRQINYGLGTAFNGLMGKHPPVNPTPWLGQLQKPMMSSLGK
jgi:hypothetical protein